MSIEIKVPTVGESITEVTIASWSKNSGDFVQMDEVICELESDKATFEVTAQTSGILHIKAEAQTTLPIGGLLCEIEPKEVATPKNNAPTQKASPTSSTQPSQTVAIKIPAVGESITEVTIANWVKKDGDFVKMDENIAEIESDKATFELAASTNGILKIVVPQGETVKIGTLVCNIIESNEAPQNITTLQPVKSETVNAPKQSPNYAEGHTSPAASKILSEKGILPESVKGTGRDNRITKEDAMNAQKTQATAPQTLSNMAPQNIGNRNQRRVKMSSLRKTVSRRLVSVKNETAMLTTFNEVNMKPIMDIRKKYKDSFKEKFEVGLGFMSFFTKACCMALQEWQAVNAMIEGDEIVYNDFCDVSIAVSAPKGLVVPVIRNADSMSFEQIEKEIVRLATKARDNKLTIDEMTGGTFTITNGGVFGSMMSTPIINAPQSAILGMHNIVERPMAVDGEVKILPMMYIALSYDHRIIDGRESVSFLVRVKQLLEDPTRILLGV